MDEPAENNDEIPEEALAQMPLSDPLIVVFPNPFFDQTTLHFSVDVLPVKLYLYLASNPVSVPGLRYKKISMDLGKTLLPGTYVLVIDTPVISTITDRRRVVRLVKKPPSIS